MPTVDHIAAEQKSRFIRRRKALGDSPTCLVKSVLKEPKLSKPTSKQTSVTGRCSDASSSLARSMRRWVRYSCGVNSNADRKQRRKWKGESCACFEMVGKSSGCV